MNRPQPGDYVLIDIIEDKPVFARVFHDIGEEGFVIKEIDKYGDYDFPAITSLIGWDNWLGSLRTLGTGMPGIPNGILTKKEAKELKLRLIK